jgi:hypothetical protein
LNKPPLGIMPKSIWDSKRIDELTSAIDRYMEAGEMIPNKWIEEYNQIIDNYNFEIEYQNENEITFNNGEKLAIETMMTDFIRDMNKWHPEPIFMSVYETVDLRKLREKLRSITKSNKI